MPTYDWSPLLIVALEHFCFLHGRNLNLNWTQLGQQSCVDSREMLFKDNNGNYRSHLMYILFNSVSINYNKMSRNCYRIYISVCWEKLNKQNVQWLNNNWNIIKCRPCGILRELIKSSKRAGDGWVEHNRPTVLCEWMCECECVAFEFSIGCLKVQKLHIVNKTSLWHFISLIYGGTFS